MIGSGSSSLILEILHHQKLLKKIKTKVQLSCRGVFWTLVSNTHPLSYWVKPILCVLNLDIYFIRRAILEMKYVKTEVFNKIKTTKLV